MTAFPSLPLFTDVWVSNTKHLSRLERGTYHDLLVLMWQSPGCRVPNDDAWLGRRLGMTLEEVKNELRPLIAEFCRTDGNHLTQKRLLKEWSYCRKRSAVASGAAKSLWEKKKVSRVKLSRSKAPNPNPNPNLEESKKDSPSLALTGGESVQDDWPKDFRDKFWNAYPRKAEKKDAMRRLEVVRKSGAVSFAALLAAIRRYAVANPDLKYVKHPAVWLNKGCWDDQINGAGTALSAGSPAYLKTPPGMMSLDEIRNKYGGKSNGQNNPATVRGDAGMGKKGSDHGEQLQLPGGGARSSEVPGAPRDAPDDHAGK